MAVASLACLAELRRQILVEFERDVRAAEVARDKRLEFIDMAENAAREEGEKNATATHHSDSAPSA